MTESEKAYMLSRFDNQLVVEMNIEDAKRARDEQAKAGPQKGQQTSAGEPVEKRAEAEPGIPQAEDAREPRADLVPDVNQPVPDKKIEREAEAAEYELTRRGEMTDARAARLARLQSVSDHIERENSERESNGPERDQDAGDRSR
jgi:hypothetical protein